MKYIKTYGINGLLEWHGVLKCGATSMKVSFTGGTTTAYGVAPATFTTKDELTQFVVENSDKFKEGRIILLRKQAIGEEQSEAERVSSEEALPAAASPQLEEKTFSCGDDAKSYLMEEHGFPISRLRNKAQMEKAAEEVGVKIVWA